MTLWENDVAAVFADAGVTVTLGEETCDGLWRDEQRDEDFVADLVAQSRERSLLILPGSLASLAVGAVLEVSGIPYVVRSYGANGPRGVFTQIRVVPQ